MALQVLVDGVLVELPPRRAEMIRQLLKEDLELDTMDVGELWFVLSHDKVSIRRARSQAPVRVLSWAAWRREHSEK